MLTCVVLVQSAQLYLVDQRKVGFCLKLPVQKKECNRYVLGRLHKWALKDGCQLYFDPYLLGLPITSITITSVWVLICLMLIFLPDLRSRFQWLNGCPSIPRTVQDSKVGGAVHHAHAVLKSSTIRVCLQTISNDHKHDALSVTCPNQNRLIFLKVSNSLSPSTPIFG